MRYLSLLTVFCLLPLYMKAQNTDQSAWLAIINSTRFNKSWGLHLDVQVRSSDRLEYLRNVMFRPGLTYHLSKKTNLTLGYLLNDTYVPAGSGEYNRLSEHRVWEQFVYNMPVKRSVLMHRLRLEQRFIEQQSSDIFSQRLRYMLRAVLPVTRQDSTFKRGPFVGLQNEVFFHLQNRDKLSGNIFDQNRAYLALGYRFNPKVDLEAGYLNQFVKGRVQNTNNHVIQVALYTRF